MKFKGLLALALAVTLSQASAATQPFNTYNFAGVKWLGTRSVTKSIMTSKGYKYLGLCKEVYNNCTKYEDNDQVYSGMVLEKKADISAFFNHEGRLVRITIGIESGAVELINKYKGGVKILEKKYGKPYQSTEKYDAPYSSGSLSEALEIGKADVSDSWFTKDDPQKRYEGLTIRLTRGPRLEMVYTSQFWEAEKTRRSTGGGNDL